MSRLALLCLFLFTGYSLSAQKECVTTQYEDQLLKQYPALQHNINASRSFLSNPRLESVMGAGTPAGVAPVITIPVVVHVLYKDASQNISDEQIHSQIDVLNKAFQLLHADTNKIPARFRDLAANCRIEFCLAKVDPQGYATNGIVRRSTWVTMYGVDDRIKFTDQGGSDAWDSQRYLNIWVGNLAGGIVGYSSPIGGPANKDGIAILPVAFGTVGTARAPYHLGKTMVHEVGHWLGLRHIWGDALCGDDLVDDTPTQRSSNRGCPSGVKLSCATSGNGDMYMNYMDLTSDDCMLMFTHGQMNRMRAAFAPGGPRHGILSSQGCSGTPIPKPIGATVVAEPVVKVMDVYPNPVRSSLIIDISENAELLGSEVQIVNHWGQPVKTLRLSQLKTTIPVAHLAGGMYIIRLSGGNGGVGKYQEKFLKL